MSEMVVTSKEELEKAKEAGVDTIIVKGEFAEKLYKARKLTTIGSVALAAIVGVVGTTAVTGGLSMAALAPVAAMSGIDVAIIIIAATIGIGLILALYKEYEVIEVGYDSGGMVLRLEKKK